MGVVEHCGGALVEHTDIQSILSSLSFIMLPL